MLFSIYSRLLYFLNDFSVYLVLIILSFLVFIFLSSYVIHSQKSETRKKIYVIVLFTIFLGVLIYSFFEAYMRYRFDESDSLGFLKVTGRWFKRHVVFNSYFVRDREFTLEKKEGTIRIGVIGDSIAFGYGIKNVNNRFSNILEQKLRSAHYNVEVYNLGKSGYDTDTEILEYEKNKKLNFDIIVWEYFLNDAQPQGDSRGTKVLIKEHRQNKILSLLSSKSYFFDYVYWRLSKRYEKTFKELRNADMDAYHDSTTFKKHKNDVLQFIQELKSDNTKFVVIIFPFMYFLPDYPAYDIHKTMNGIFKENNVEVIDLLDDLKHKQSKEVIVGRYDYHPNEWVQQLAAQRLYDKIMPLLQK